MRLKIDRRSTTTSYGILIKNNFGNRPVRMADLTYFTLTVRVSMLLSAFLNNAIETVRCFFFLT